MTNENKQFETNKIIKEEPKEIKSPNWFDKNKFKEILATTDSNKFNYKNNIGEFKYTHIKDLVDNIKNNTISEIDAKKDLKVLNEIKKAEIIKYKKHTPGHKKLLNLFGDLSDIILTDKTLESQKNKKVENRKEENKYKNEDDEYENENEDYENENEDDDETINQNKIIKEKNDPLDKIIDKSKSFEDQIESLKKVEYLDDYYYDNNFDDKKIKYQYFKIKLTHLSNEIDKKLFEQIFGHNLIKLADKLINTTNKKENQIIVNNINKNESKLFKKHEFNDFLIQAQQSSD